MRALGRSGSSRAIPTLEDVVSLSGRGPAISEAWIMRPAAIHAPRVPGARGLTGGAVTRITAALGIAAIAVLGLQAQQPQFRSGVELVELAVTVTDDDGVPVTDLTAADFIVEEEGERQAIATFHRVDVPVSDSSSADFTSVVRRDVASNDVSPEARVLALVLDDLHVSARRTSHVRKAACQFIEEFVAPSDLVAIVSTGGRGDIVQEFTTDKSRMLRAVDRFVGQKLRSAAAAGPGTDEDDELRTIYIRNAMDTLVQMAEYLGSVRGRRKTMLLFSEGVDYNIYDLMGKKQRNADEVRRAMERAIGALTRANVVLYAIDPRGLWSAEGDLIDTNLPVFEPPSVDLSEPGIRGEAALSLQSLRHIAEETGGFAAVETNDFTGAFHRVIQESSSYYLLGYYPSDPATGDAGKFRRVDVKVSRPDVRVATRRGYFVPGDERRAAGESEDEDAPPPGVPPHLASLLGNALPTPGLPIRVQAIPFKGSGKEARVGLVVEIDGKELSFEEVDGRFTTKLEIALLTIDGKGRTGNGTYAAVNLRLPPDELQRVQLTGLRWLSGLDLPAGRYTLKLAVSGGSAAQTGVVIADIEVPKFEDDDQVSMSGVMLTSLPAALMLTSGTLDAAPRLPTPPTAVRRFVAGDQLTAAVLVYGREVEQAVVVTARVETSDGTSRMTAERVLAPAQLQRGSGRAVFAIPTGQLLPGSYLLRLTAQSGDDGEAPAETVLPFDVVALAHTRTG